MKAKLLTSLMALCLLAAVPMAAQVEEQPAVEPTAEEQQGAFDEPTALDEREAFDEEEAFAEPIETTEAMPVSSDENPDGELPKTASALPLLALLGCLSAGVAFLARRTRRQR